MTRSVVVTLPRSARPHQGSAVRTPWSSAVTGDGRDGHRPDGGVSPRRCWAGAHVQAVTPAGVAALSPRRGSVPHAATRVRRALRPPTSSSRAASSGMVLRACAVTRARTSTCSRFRARLATSAPVATPNGSRCGRSGWRRRSVAAVPHRQVVLTIPKRLRTWCLYRRALLGDLARVAARTVTAAVRMLTRESDLAVSVVACIQTHGSLANWHPHIHLLVTDGGFRADGTFVPWPAHNTAALTEAFRRPCSGSSCGAASSRPTTQRACSRSRTRGFTCMTPCGCRTATWISRSGSFRTSTR